MKVSGLKGLDDKLGKLGASVGKKFLRGAMMTATTPMLKVARSLTPVGKYKTPKKDRKSGSLRKALRRKTMVGRSRDRHTMAVRMSFNLKKAWYWHFITGGVAPHDVSKGAKRKRKSVRKAGTKLRTRKSKDRGGRKPRMHPGFKGRDILGISFRITRKESLNRFTKSLTRRIEKVAVT